MQTKFLVILLLFSVLGFSASIDVSLPHSTCGSSMDFLTTITNLPQCIAEAIFSSLVNGLIYSAQQFYNFSIGLLTATPDLTWFCAPYLSIMSILESFYVIMLMGLGIYYIVNSSEVEGRVKSKIWLKNIFFMIVCLAFSFGIFQLIIDINQYISTTMYASVSSSLFTINAHLSNLIFALIFAGSLSYGGMLTFSTLIARYLMIPLLLFLFPIGIFLYFMPPTKQWGAFIFQMTLLVVFMTSIDALLLSGISALFSSPDPTLADSFVRAFGLMAGFGMIGMVNLMIFLISILSVLGKVVQAGESSISTIWKVASLIALL